jgi:hypothetical protein
MKPRCSALLACLTLLLGLPFAATGAAAETLVYEIQRDGEIIGEQRVEIEGDRVEITQEIEVSALFITLYSRSHRRVETWSEGRILRIEATTDDDGTPFELLIEAEGEGYRRTVNGVTESFGADYGFAPDWNLAVADRPKALSAQTDEIYDPLIMERQGRDLVTLEISSGSYRTQRWEASGAFERDLWYDEDGRLVQMLFQSRGARIEYFRK